MQSKDILLSRSIMLVKTKDLGFALSHKAFLLGNKWLQWFKDRHNTTCKNVVGEVASVDQGSLQQWMDKHCDQILAYSDKDIYNADQKEIFFQLLPSKTLTIKMDKCVAGKSSKSCVIVLISVNMGGSYK